MLKLMLSKYSGVSGYPSRRTTGFDLGVNYPHKIDLLLTFRETRDNPALTIQLPLTNDLISGTTIGSGRRPNPLENE